MFLIYLNEELKSRMKGSYYINSFSMKTSIVVLEKYIHDHHLSSLIHSLCKAHPFLPGPAQVPGD